MASGKLLLGLDIGSSSAKICLLKEIRGSYEVQVVDSAPFESDDIVDGQIMNAAHVSEVIGELIKRNNIKQKQCAIAISGYSVIVKRVRMPDMSDDELRDNLRWEVEQHIPYEYDDVVVDTVLLDRNVSQKKMEILLVATKKDVVREYISVARDAGLEVKVVDTVSFALHNMAQVAYKDEMQDQIVCIINVGASMTSITTTGAKGVPSFTRDITIGGNQISQELMKKFNIKREEAEAFKTGSTGSVDSVLPREVEDITKLVSENIAGEIRRSINFFYETTESDHIDKILLCGGAIQNATTRATLERAFDVPTIVINPFEHLKFNAKCYTAQALEDRALESAVAFGLALRSTNE